MSATQQRDQVSRLAKRNPHQALEKARGIRDPWFMAQALSWVARYTDDDPVAIAREAAEAASRCEDEYKKTAFRAWEIAALGAWSHRRGPEHSEVSVEASGVDLSFILSFRSPDFASSRLSDDWEG